MAFTNCPKCARRLQVPDGSQEMTLRCPACKHTFRATTPAAEPAMANVNPALENGQDLDQEDSDFGTLGEQRRILSAADEAMLREFGSGSGLLELTREAIELSPGQAKMPASAPGPMDADQEEMSDRQFQIVGTALTMANRLVQVYKSELTRTRRISLAAWIAAAAMVAVSVLIFWWGMNKSNSADIEKRISETVAADLGRSRSEAKSAKENFAQELDDARKTNEKAQAELTTLRGNLEDARSETRKTLTELSSAREAAAESKGSIQVLTNNLSVANAKVLALEAQVAQLRAASRPTGQP